MMLQRVELCQEELFLVVFVLIFGFFVLAVAEAGGMLWLWQEKAAQTAVYHDGWCANL